jgi:hypothetical protein
MNILVLFVVFAVSTLLLTLWQRALGRRLAEIEGVHAGITLFAGTALGGFLRYVAVVTHECKSNKRPFPASSLSILG